MKIHAELISTGAYCPGEAVPNESLTQFPADAIPLIGQKTGVMSRHYAAETQATSDLGFEAAKSCLSRANVAAENIDAIILATSSPDRVQPATATRIQHLLGATRAFAFDINSVCGGTVFAIHVARGLIESEMCRNILVVGAEIYSRWLNPRDFSTYPYFGDGAGALLLSAGMSDRGVLHSICHSDGAGSDIIQVPGGGTLLPFAKMSRPEDACFRMRGRQVYDFAVEKGTEVIRELLDGAGLELSEISRIIPHQANINILHEQALRLGVRDDLFFHNLERVGNTAAASIPIALHEAIVTRAVATGDRVVLVGFGGGLSWGSVLLRL